MNSDLQSFFSSMKSRATAVIKGADDIGTRSLLSVTGAAAAAGLVFTISVSQEAFAHPTSDAVMMTDVAKFLDETSDSMFVEANRKIEQNYQAVRREVARIEASGKAACIKVVAIAESVRSQSNQGLIPPLLIPAQKAVPCAGVTEDRIGVYPADEQSAASSHLHYILGLTKVVFYDQFKDRLQARADMRKSQEDASLPTPNVR